MFCDWVEVGIASNTLMWGGLLLGSGMESAQDEFAGVVFTIVHLCIDSIVVFTLFEPSHYNNPDQIVFWKPLSVPLNTLCTLG